MACVTVGEALEVAMFVLNFLLCVFACGLWATHSDCLRNLEVVHEVPRVAVKLLDYQPDVLPLLVIQTEAEGRADPAGRDKRCLSQPEGAADVLLPMEDVDLGDTLPFRRGSVDRDWLPEQPCVQKGNIFQRVFACLRRLCA